MTGVCGMKKAGHTSFQCLRALVAISYLTGARLLTPKGLDQTNNSRYFFNKKRYVFIYQVILLIIKPDDTQESAIEHESEASQAN